VKTDLYIGPLLERSGKFSYDTFSVTDGRRSSFRYPRIEEARYDRRAMIAEAGSGLHHQIHLCETVAEFDRLVAAAEGDKTVADRGQSSEL
jgi:hypothetical protein